jgi:hypothetical protein
VSSPPPGNTEAALGRQLLALLAAGGLLTSLFISQATAFPYPWALLPVIATTALMVLFAGPTTWVARVLTQKPFMWLGLRSYSIYLWHWPVFILFKWTLGLEGVLNAVVASGLAIVLGAMSYRLIENPVRHAPLVKRQTRPRVIVAGLATVTTLALLTGVVFKARPQISLSVTANESTWFPYEKDDPPPDFGQCAVERQETVFEGGLLTTYRPVNCNRTAPGKLFAAGDSHATAYGMMLRRFAAETGSVVKVFNQPGCPFLTLQQTNAELPAPCAHFVQASLGAMAKEAGPQDVVFLAALRVPRLADQQGLNHSSVEAGLHAQQRDRSAAVTEAFALLAPLASTQARLVFEAPKPVLPSPTFRCADWFNKMNPVCKEGSHIPRNTMLAYLAPAKAAVAQLSAQLPGSTIWDPTDVLCDAENCSAYRDGKPLIFDGDHISGFANTLLAPYFTAMVHQLQAPPVTAAQLPD